MSLSDERGVGVCLTKFLHCVSTTNGLKHSGIIGPKAKLWREAGREERKG